MSVGAVIFDCDGVLVDSEPISISVLVETIQSAGVPIDVGTAYSLFLGQSITSVADILDREYQLQLTSGQIDRMRVELSNRFRQQLQAVPGVREAASAVAFPKCVASSSNHDRVQLSLKLTGLLNLFGSNIYTSAQVKQGKPAPDLFLFAAKSMGVEPGQCVVIEDSTAGIMAARNAGMRVLAFVGGSHAAAGGLYDSAVAMDPVAVFSDMAHLPGLLASLDE